MPHMPYNGGEQYINYSGRCGAYFTALHRHGRGKKGDGEVEKETVEGWQEMEGKEKVVWMVDKACDSVRV